MAEAAAQAVGEATRGCSLGATLFLDLPYILDSAWRRTEFDLNRRFNYYVPAGDQPARLEARRYWQFPSFWLLLLALLFAAYGSTFHALCSAITPTGVTVLRYAIGLALAALTLWTAYSCVRGGYRRANDRFTDPDLLASYGEVTRCHRILVQTGVWLGSLAAATPAAFLTYYLLNTVNANGCRNDLPSAPARWQLLAFLAAVAAAYLFAGSRTSSTRREQWQGPIFLGLCAVLWLWIAPPGAREADQGPYPHVFGVIACLLGAIVMLTPLLVRLQFRSLQWAEAKAFRTALAATELFPPPRSDPDLSLRRVFSALALGVTYHPLQMLLLPGLMLLVCPSHLMMPAALAAFLLACFLVTIGNLSSRWQQMVLSINRWFLNGTPLAVSAFVILIAVLRLFNFQYVATILDAAPFGDIFVWAFSAYVLFWWFEYAINDALSRTLLALLAPAADAKTDEITYTLARGISETVADGDRRLVAHGAGLFAVLGYLSAIDPIKKKRTRAFHAFPFIALFSALADKCPDALNDLRRRIELYFLTVNAAVLTCAVGLALYFGHGDRALTVHPMVVVGAPPAEGEHYADLRALLARTTGAAGRPAIVVAASGGGTRAALYAAETLRGLARLQAIDDVVLVSGVSGGGVASAYFYAHQAALLSGAADAPAWDEYVARMADPFISDVMDGAGEWRVVSAYPLGVLLAESFQRRLFNGPDAARLGFNPQLGLILNTSVAGHPQEDAQALNGAFASVPASLPCSERHRPYSALSGGRLVFTNLADVGHFPARESVLTDVRFPYVIVRSGAVPLAEAAALNANFPPVFPNGRIDVPAVSVIDDCPLRSYYVTDGGATENLGLISALYALPDLAALRDIHIVAVEASATAYDYTPDRGIGAATGGSKERLAGGLTQSLLERLCRLLEPGTPRDAQCATTRLQTHYLPLPLVFRSRGGFGTHWMFPTTIEVSNPRIAALPTGLPWLLDELNPWRRTRRVLSQNMLLELWSDLYQPDTQFCSRPDHYGSKQERTTARWICGAPGEAEDAQIGAWQEVVRTLNARRAPMPPLAAPAH
jgi:hypothetical protein